MASQGGSSSTFSGRSDSASSASMRSKGLGGRIGGTAWRRAAICWRCSASRSVRVEADASESRTSSTNLADSAARATVSSPSGPVGRRHAGPARLWLGRRRWVPCGQPCGPSCPIWSAGENRLGEVQEGPEDSAGRPSRKNRAFPAPSAPLAFRPLRAPLGFRPPSAGSGRSTDKPHDVVEPDPLIEEFLDPPRHLRAEIPPVEAHPALALTGHWRPL